MKKKIMREILALFMIFTVMFSAANITVASAASDEKVPRNAWDVTDEEEEKPPVAKYTDWAFNDDYTKVTINGKSYDNYIVIVRNNQELVMMNMWGMYLTSPYDQMTRTPDEVAAGLDDSLNAIFSGNESKYPLNELVSINGIPWQDTKFKDKYLSYFETFYDSQFTNTISKTDLWNILEDKSYNGLALGIIREKLTKDQATVKYDLSKMKVTVQDWEMVKTGAEFAAKNGGQAYVPTELTYPTQDDLKEAMKEDAPTQTKLKITVVLYLNNPIMTVSNGSTTKTVTLEAAPYAPNGTTLVPVRAITEAFGSTVDWDGTTQEVLITKDNTTIKLKIGSKTVYVNGNAVEMLEAAQIINGKTVIPLRFISENMGYKVEWDGATSKITISN